ncbi:MAG TPA: hypothetical protein VL126_15800 [Bacteroidota bacterium]|nr:hypothetical protein [Bacteroidota bacterium]
MTTLRKSLVALLTISLCAGMVLAQGTHPVKVRKGNVRKVVTVANPKVWNGHAPAHLKFTGTIFVNNPPVEVEYTWIRSDGAKSPVGKVTIASAGQGFTDTWDVGAPKERMKVWERLEVISPNKASSNPAFVIVNCK